MSKTTQTFRKDPDAVLDYGFDWQGGEKPFLETGEIISTSTWTLDAGITKDSDTSGDTTTKVWLSGGTAGTTYRVTNEITTSQGRTENRSFEVVVEET